jgi:hypothetical protein
MTLKDVRSIQDELNNDDEQFARPMVVINAKGWKGLGKDARVLDRARDILYVPHGDMSVAELRDALRSGYIVLFADEADIPGGLDEVPEEDLWPGTRTAPTKKTDRDAFSQCAYQPGGCVADNKRGLLLQCYKCYIRIHEGCGGYAHHHSHGRFSCRPCSLKLEAQYYYPDLPASTGSAKSKVNNVPSDNWLKDRIKNRFEVLGDDESESLGLPELRESTRLQAASWAGVTDACGFTLRSGLGLATDRSGSVAVSAEMHRMVAEAQDISASTGRRAAALRELIARETGGMPGPFSPVYRMGMGYVPVYLAILLVLFSHLI